MENGERRKRPFVRAVIGLLVALFAVLAGYTALDMRQGKGMAVDACRRAAKGTLLDDILPMFSAADYRTIKGPERILLVPKKGMGRFNCAVTHDGRMVTGASVNFID